MPGAFGRRGLGQAPALMARDSRPARPAGNVVLLSAVAALLGMTVAGVLWTISDINALNARTAATTDQVVEIVNQPVTHLPRTAEAGLFAPGWFHPGAIRPDFGRVDVRTSQEFPYATYTYVTSDLNPSDMFVADELEFNAMTKYFYVDRTVPKKKLSEREMLQINDLYRLIGHHDDLLHARWLTLVALVLTGGGLGYAAVSVFRRTQAPDRSTAPGPSDALFGEP